MKKKIFTVEYRDGQSNSREIYCNSCGEYTTPRSNINFSESNNLYIYLEILCSKCNSTLHILHIHKNK